MREKTLFAIGLIMAVVLAVIGIFFPQRVWDVITLTFLTTILTLNIQLYFHLKDGDPLFGRPINALRSRGEIGKQTAEMLTCLADGLDKNDPFITRQIEMFVRDARATTRSLNDGVLAIDLRPGGMFFRETDAVDFAVSRFRATSLVDIDRYWSGAPGTRLINKGRAKVQSGVVIERLFMEYRDNLAAAEACRQRNLQSGVRAMLAIADDLDARLLRDFALIDDALAVELILKNREPVEAIYYSRATPDGRRKIAELDAVWKELMGCCVLDSTAAV
ncbi:hypothetical protein [Sphingobium sp. B11D3A]|uniref:hypothetical protein n=1 Tax=Sphingobium sp. B11D3A TaxID=2940574 RepID=UPI002224F362|nr:hypothetical protein [Sphingobium sp. B11D3A]MCW2391923.1 hypothetical protein [Sphingobium sp. B11D3A]